ncbi:MAG: tripartite tricarboxylate transporter permease [Betaproteobacteria bacterium]
MSELALAWQAMTTSWAIPAAFAGVAWGIGGGALPGISPSIAMALLLPFTHGMEPVAAIVLLASVYVGAEYGGSIPAILIRTPGTNAAAATVIDGFEMNRRGRGGEALGISLVAGLAGGLFGLAVLVLATGPLARVALAFTPPAYFALGVLGLSAVAGLSGRSLLKGLMAATLGLMIATIGTDPVSGVQRFTFHSPDLLGGIRPKSALAGWEASGGCTAIGHARTLDAAGAAFVNGTAAHGEDFDDTFEGGPVHAGAVVVPAVLAVCERNKLSGKDALRGIAVGAELMCRASLVAAKLIHKAGFHPTAILGAIAAAGAVAVSPSLSRPHFVNALGIAGSMASGIGQYLLGQHEECEKTLRLCLAREPANLDCHLVIAAAQHAAGRADAARREAQEILRKDPAFRIAGYQARLAIVRDRALVERFFALMRELGLQ